MENFESGNKEHKYNSTKWHEQEAEKAREKIKKLMEENERLGKESERLKKKLDDLLST